MTTKNILIVGNGFDLSHYLPTKYDHFMVAMSRVEKWKEVEGALNFDQIFAQDYKWMDALGNQLDNEFYQYTKALYDIKHAEFSFNTLKEIQKYILGNAWYSYFSDHTTEVKTWIDFETKIEEALDLICKFIEKIDNYFQLTGNCDNGIYLLDLASNGKNDAYYLSELQVNLLLRLKLLEKNNKYGSSSGGLLIDLKLADINKKWFTVEDKGYYGFSSSKYFSFLNHQLGDLIEALGIYLNFVSTLKPQHKFDIDKFLSSNIDELYSFNYTDTFSIFYRISPTIEKKFLHGRSAPKQNMVLGVSDIKNAHLRKFKAYGFTKYHQKLFKGTDYHFLDKYKNRILFVENEIETLQIKRSDRISKGLGTGAIDREIESAINKRNLDIKIYIWGHSLDISDRSYIEDLFDLNNKMDRGVTITIFHFNDEAKFLMLSNLLDILGKEKVEEWMKNSWLIFEENPQVFDKTKITLEPLPNIISI